MRHDEDVRGFRVRPAHPCPVPWEAMAGSQRVRTYASCRSRVYEFTGLDRAGAEALLGATPGALVVREDGTYLERDSLMRAAMAQHRRRWWRRAKLLTLAPVIAAVVTVVVGLTVSGASWAELPNEVRLPPTPTFDQRERE